MEITKRKDVRRIKRHKIQDTSYKKERKREAKKMNSHEDTKAQREDECSIKRQKTIDTRQK